MMKRKPQVLSHVIENHSVTLALKVDRDIQDFEGHFPTFPLLPGVTQIDWVLYYAEYYLNLSLPFIGMEVIKFQEPILPEAIVNLQINWDETKGKLQFTYTSAQTTTHSTGKIKLGRKE
ncbi:ApeI family dehydratase [Vibrio algarum]|uniref:3-hydroxyacyl-ACP dehydratase n=1 Tax=Vibrio algarum TaxID=3020714 RepID=A0ABT4YPY1_9VIBR|nr:3-hydroxyacyl-ACP dehydratase [Vibrio sp. KJ40-1]MDB1123261.1 3-hydroxyacyl-ACP dehydratase [Vibrio sp. KJ40-1]